MAHSKEYNNEELNYFRICYVTTSILTEGLRVIFKQEWDKQYKSTPFGEWKDDLQNGVDFYNAESPRNRKRNAHLLTTMKNGDRGEWDCTMLFYALLFSDCVGPSLNATVRNTLDDLRIFRNEEFAHIRQGNLSDKDFHTAISKVHAAFQALGLPTVQIQDIKIQKTFPTEDLRKILKEVEELKQELQEKEDQLQEKEDQRSVLEHQLMNDAPSFCILPPKPSHDIGVREREVGKLTQQLRELKEANDNRLSILYLSGNPGSGKSQLAGLVARKFFEESKEVPDASSFVMTVNAASPDSLLESYTSFARQLKCPDYSVVRIVSSREWTIEEKIANLKMLISAKINLYTSWLLVVDNVTCVSSITDSLPKSGNDAWVKGQLLITTQDTASIPLTTTFINHISVSKGMEPEDASFLLAKLSGITDVEMEGKVAEKLDYQPLSLASAAIYVKEIRQAGNKRNFGWKELLKKLVEGKRNTTEKTLAETNPVYPNTMTRAITLAVKTQINSNETLKHLFNFFSQCAPQPLNLSIAIDYIKRVHEMDNDQISLRIRRCSLLLLEDYENSIFIRVHQVVYDAVKSLLTDYKESQQSEVINRAIEVFNQFLVDISLSEIEALDTIHIVPHLKVLSHNVFKEENLCRVYDESILKAFANFGQTCRAHCEFNVAKRCFKRLVAVEMRELGAEHVNVAGTYNDLGDIHYDLSDFQLAKECYQHALAIRLKNLGAEHVDVATTYDNLGSIHSQLGDFEQAKEYHQRALAIYLEKLGTEHVDVATTYNNLGEIHRQLGNFEQAKEYHQRALAIDLEKLGDKHVYVATTYSNLGVIHSHLGEFKQAKEHHQHALAIRLEKQGSEHVDIATTYNNLGVIHSHLGEFEQAKEYHQRALAICLKKQGAEHVDVATTYNNLGSIHRYLGDFEQAKEYHLRALAIDVKKLGAKHVYVATTYNNLGSIYSKLGKFEQAKEYHQRALTIDLETLGAEHVDIATTYNNLGVIHSHQGEFEQAKEYHQLALAIRLKKLGAEHVDTANTYNNLGEIQRQLGDFEQAKEYHQRALAIRLEKLGDEHVDVAATYNKLGITDRQLGNFEQAKEYHQRSLRIRLENLGDEHVDVATSYNDLGVIHRRLGYFKQAKEFHQRALGIRLKRLGDEHVDVATTYSDLGELQRQLGDFKQAKEYYQLALGIRLEKLGDEHVDVAASYNNLGVIHRQLGHFEQAKEFHQRALEILVKKLGDKHVDVATTQIDLGLIYRQLGDFEQAKEHHECTLASHEKFDGEH